MSILILNKIIWHTKGSHLGKERDIGSAQRKGCDLTVQEHSHFSKTRDLRRNLVPSTFLIGFPASRTEEN